MQRAANCAHALAQRIKPRSHEPWRCAVSSAFSASDISGTAPRPSRSSGTKREPERAARVGVERAGRLRRQMRIASRVGDRSLAGERGQQLLLAVAGDAGDADDLAARAPSRRMSLERRAERIVGRAATARRRPARGSPRRALARWLRMRQVAADHHARQRCGGLARADRSVPVTLPPRSTVARSHSARISSSLWLM